MEIGGLSFDLGTLNDSRKPDPNEIYDLLILGGGPAAMAAAVYAARKMMKLALITVDFGGQVATTSQVENYLGFQMVEGSELVEKFKQQVWQFDLPVLQWQPVIKVEPAGEMFHVTVEDRTVYPGRTVLLATGNQHRRLNVPGEAELTGKGVAYCATCDAPFFKERNVVVAGGGNSAFTAALDLLKVAAAVTMINYAEGWQGDAVLLEAIRKYPNLTMLDYHQFLKIEGERVVTGVVVQDRRTGEEKRLPADGIFVEIGLSPNSSMVEGLAEMTPQREVIIDCHCRTSVPGLFAAGDVTTVPFKQIVISAGEGAKAALSAYDYLVQKGWL